jgi:cysteine desulfurase/selenocysteine lyase
MGDEEGTIMLAKPASGPAGCTPSHTAEVELSCDRPGIEIGPRPGDTSVGVEAVRSDFPALDWELRPGVSLVYLDSAATALKPWPVIRAVREYDVDYPAAVHRGLHTLSERATAAYESARGRVARFLGAADPACVIFTHGTTESINLVAQSWGGTFLEPGDEILLTVLEHHANLVPWQMLARRRGLSLRFAEIDDDGRLDLGSFDRQFSDRVRFVAVTAASNVLGTMPPLGAIVARARQRGAKVLIDAAQAIAHRPMDVAALDADFVAFSGHKVYGPTGVGVLYAKREHLEAMPPMLGGGSMVLRVDREGAEWNEVPWKFEAGTPPIAQAIGLGAAVDYLARFEGSGLRAHEEELTRHAYRVLSGLGGVRLLGPDPREDPRVGIIGFLVDGVQPHDLAQLLDREGVAIRAGHHCAMPLHQRLGIGASARASFGLYNTFAEVERLAEAIERAKCILRRPSGRSRPAPSRPGGWRRPTSPPSWITPSAATGSAWIWLSGLGAGSARCGSKGKDASSARSRRRSWPSISKGCRWSRPGTSRPARPSSCSGSASAPCGPSAGSWPGESSGEPCPLRSDRRPAGPAPHLQPHEIT